MEASYLQRQRGENSRRSYSLIARRALLKIDLSVGYVVSDWSPTSIVTNK
jgi:hypothetical protein